MRTAVVRLALDSRQSTGGIRFLYNREDAEATGCEIRRAPLIDEDGARDRLTLSGGLVAERQRLKR